MVIEDKDLIQYTFNKITIIMFINLNDYNFTLNHLYQLRLSIENVL